MTDILITNESVQQVVHIAKSIARENYNGRYGGAHLLQALMHKDIDLTDFILSLDREPGYFYEWAAVRIEEYPKTIKLPEEITADVKISDLWEQAHDVKMKLGLGELTPLCLLAAIVKPGVIFSVEELKSLPLREQDIFGAFQDKSSFVYQELIGGEEKGEPQSGEMSKFTALTNYCIDLTAKARKGAFDNLVGRERETRTLVEILGRKSKPNVILVGEPGVGKTALVEGFANQLALEDVPEVLKGSLLLQVDLSVLLSGISYKGEAEDRLKKVLIESKKIGNSILFFDEIHTLLDPNGNAGGIANLLKPELARGEITVIGATTQVEYRKIIEPDMAFNRRFEFLEVDEPTEKTCVKMLESIVDKYQQHHNVTLEAGALLSCVRLSKRYSKGKKLPDIAVDLLDRTMAAINLLDELSISELTNWKTSYDAVFASEFENELEKVEEMQWMFSQLQAGISPILWGSLVEQPEIDSNYSSDKAHSIITSIYNELLGHAQIVKGTVGTLELAAVMAAKTGIPIGKIQAQEKDKLLNLESLLSQRVVGQDHALKILTDAIIESRSGLNKPGQPIGSFFLLGPTGTGKTELAKSIAALLFNDEKAMIRFDMSEFKEEHSAALLYGAPPGYVGYEEGGMLVNKIRQQPYAVVLFDEIEKAHQSVFDVFLQIMDEGKIHDKLGKEGDFSNALILFTSNIGSQFIIDEFAQNQIPKSKDLMQIMSKNFRPEFLARISEIVPFSPITESIAEQIFRIQLKSLIRALDRLGIALEITDEAVYNLALNGFNSEYGARQISGVIRQQIARPISKMIVREELVGANTIVVDFENQETIFKVQ